MMAEGEGPSYQKVALRSTGPDPDCSYIVSKPFLENEESSKMAICGSVVTGKSLPPIECFSKD